MRHLRSTLSERLCSRQIWAGRFSPVDTCRQHWSLNSLVWFLLKLSSFTSGCNSRSELLEKLPYGTVRWNGCTPRPRLLYPSQEPQEVISRSSRPSPEKSSGALLELLFILLRAQDTLVTRSNLAYTSNLRQACLRLRYAARDEYVAVGVAAVIWRAAAGTTATYGGPVTAVLMALMSSSSVTVPLTRMGSAGGSRA